NVVKAYRKARVTQSKDKRVRRGRSHSISSVAEDLFAEFLVLNDKTIEAVYVDQPISVAIGRKRKQFYPDIMIVRNEVIVSFVDIKLDIGWNRDGLTDLCKKHKATVQAVRGKECRLRDGVTKKMQHLKIADSLSYNVVMISRTNINAEILEKHEERITKLAPEVDLFILCDTGHPNNYVSSKNIIEELGVNDGVFKRLHKKLK
ncbi:hypothetical protein N8083_00630, partial [Candidatus Pacebacteria bacterium]|nr:hypothetical protein [Candidatus Paceibacterota bacterium]